VIPDARMAEPINLELLARHLQEMRAALREMQFHAENDRRNIRSQFDNLAATHASRFGEVEATMAARLDSLETLMGERFAHLDERVGGLEGRVGRLDERVGRLEDRMEYLITLVQQLLKK
jgi:predicted nuclease with TOPRIM domain